MRDGLVELCKTKDGKTVVYDPVGSHVATHFQDEAGLRGLAIEVLGQTIPTSPVMLFDVDLGRPVGLTALAKTDDSDEIVYAKRRNRDGYTRFTKSRQMQPCPSITIALRQLDIDTYELETAWIGYVGFPFPDEPNAPAESWTHWMSHALVWGSQEVQPGTETAVCPWTKPA